jgi:hypothetical protein
VYTRGNARAAAVVEKRSSGYEVEGKKGAYHEHHRFDNSSGRDGA